MVRPLATVLADADKRLLNVPYSAATIMVHESDDGTTYLTDRGFPISVPE